MMELFDFSPSSSEFGDPLLSEKFNLFEFSNEEEILTTTSSSTSSSTSSNNSSPKWNPALEEEDSQIHFPSSTSSFMDEDFLLGSHDFLLGILARKEEEELESHHTSPKSLLTCNLCKLVFTESSHLANHTLNFVRQNTCCLCQKSFPTSAKLTVHHRKHIREKPFECEFCLKTFTHSHTLNRHRFIYCGAVRQRCKDLLGEEISNALLPPPLRAADRRGLQEPTPPSAATTTVRSHTTCKVCEKEMFDSESLRNHSDFYLRARTCCRCSKVLGNRSKLLTHHRSHTKELPYPCHHCPKRFAESSTLRKHVATHGEKKFTCNDCGKSFVRKDYLVKHVAAVHVETYKCSRCSYVCHKEEDIRIHVDAVHAFD
eukprot:TRINITY_DN7760_c0_g1_i1.p1 TRINITY_DN7760_c0_g1~~TRINITY_DN7760_c0_g1_i1.p1  ORF type:complete len:372 (+),score=135.94 TRINITY_DN7760_c0_g1_i1:157-1272(+)